jgi:hypothetical protein
MSKRGDRHDINPTVVSPSCTYAATAPVFPMAAWNMHPALGSGASDLAMSGLSHGPPVSMDAEELSMISSATGPPPAKKSRTNTPWTLAEEQRLKTMRDAGNIWEDIAKVRN